MHIKFNVNDITNGWEDFMQEVVMMMKVKQKNLQSHGNDINTVGSIILHAGGEFMETQFFFSRGSKSVRS